MADLNTIYDGVIDTQDPDVVIFMGCRGVIIGNHCWGTDEPVYLPDDVRQKIRDTNQKALDTIANVRTEYTAGTDRAAYLKARIDAIAVRAEFVRSRASDVLDYLKSISTDAYNAVANGFISALSLLPGIGGIIASIGAGQKAAQQLEVYKAQQLVIRYTDDLKQLAAIKTQLIKDYSDLDTTGNTDPITVAPGNDAANPNTNYYYIGGALLLLVFIVWLRRKRNRK